MCLTKHATRLVYPSQALSDSWTSRIRDDAELKKPKKVFKLYCYHDQLEGPGQRAPPLLHPGAEDPGALPGLRCRQDLPEQEGGEGPEAPAGGTAQAGPEDPGAHRQQEGRLREEAER